MWKIALRPRWIGALILALAVAAGFAWLSQWQISRSVTEGAVSQQPTETVLPLAQVATPQKPLVGSAEGQRVSVSGTYNPADTVILSDRVNQGEHGYWVVAHLTAKDGAGVAVALGWTTSENAAADAKAALLQTPASANQIEVTGRLVGDEGPQTGDFQSGELHALSLGALVNVWATVNDPGVYNGYIVSANPPPGLEAIYAPSPETTVELNWLNLFYAAEWVIFAGFAVFLWWRLVRDVWEREHAGA